MRRSRWAEAREWLIIDSRHGGEGIEEGEMGIQDTELCQLSAALLPWRMQPASWYYPSLKAMTSLEMAILNLGFSPLAEPPFGR